MPRNLLTPARFLPTHATGPRMHQRVFPIKRECTEHMLEVPCWYCDPFPTLHTPQVWVRISPPVLAALSRQPLVNLSALPGAATLPNLAQPNPHGGQLGAPGDAAAAAAQGAGAGRGSGGGGEGGAGGGGGPAAGGEGDGDGDEGGGGDGDQVGDTLVLVPGTHKAMRLEVRGLHVEWAEAQALWVTTRTIMV